MGIASLQQSKACGSPGIVSPMSLPSTDTECQVKQHPTAPKEVKPPGGMLRKHLKGSLTFHSTCGMKRGTPDATTERVCAGTCYGKLSLPTSTNVCR